MRSHLRLEDVVTVSLSFSKHPCSDCGWQVLARTALPRSATYLHHFFVDCRQTTENRDERRMSMRIHESLKLKHHNCERKARITEGREGLADIE